jgi:hypothetical protein
MATNGQLAPIEILPDGTIVDGHQRLRAAEYLKWTTIKVRVRHDLASRKCAAERRMLQANRNRRQLHQLDQVRATKHLFEIEKKAQPGGLVSWTQRGLIDRLCRDLHQSRRNVRRWLAVSTASMGVQRLVQQNHMNLVDGEKASRLEPEAQARVVAAIEGGQHAEEALAAELGDGGRKAKPVNASRSFGKLIRSVEGCLDELEGVAEQVRRGGSAAHDLEVLERLQKLLGILKPLLRKQAAQARETEEGIARLVAARGAS